MVVNSPHYKLLDITKITYLIGRQCPVDSVVFLHTFENQVFVENINHVRESVADQVSLEVNCREEHILELPFISTEVGHDLHTNVKQLCLADGDLLTRGNTPSNSALSDKHPLEEVDGSVFLVGSAGYVVK
jgi:hypothetical protein